MKLAIIVTAGLLLVSTFLNVFTVYPHYYFGAPVRPLEKYSLASLWVEGISAIVFSILFLRTISLLERRALVYVITTLLILACIIASLFLQVQQHNAVAYNLFSVIALFILKVCIYFRNAQSKEFNFSVK